ncbi:MAG: V-type ATP synthase subunit I [Thermoprotei archaeon]
MLFPEAMEKVELVVPGDELSDLIDDLAQRGLVHFSISRSSQSHFDELRRKAQEIVQMASELGIGHSEIKELVEVSSWDALLDGYAQRLSSYLGKKKKIEDEIGKVTAQRQKLEQALYYLEAFPPEYDNSAFSSMRSYQHLIFLSPANLNLSYDSIVAESSKGKIYVVLSKPDLVEKVREDLRKMGAIELPYPDWLDPLAEKAKKKAEEGILELSKLQKQLTELLNSLMQEALPVASQADELSRMLLRSLEVKSGEEFTAKTRLVTGFVRESQIGELLDAAKGFPGVLVYHRKALPSDDPPTLQNLPGIASHFRVVVGSLGLPSYGEVDPTVIAAITFPVLFALMFPDAGQALSLLVLGLFMAKKLKGSLSDLGYVMTLSGAAAFVSGLAFGEFFGLEIHPLAFRIFSWQGTFSLPGTPFSVWSPSASVSLMTQKRIVTLMFLSIGVGIAQMSLGFLLSIVNHVKKGLILRAIGRELPKLILLPSAFGLLVERVSLSGLGLALWAALVIAPFILLYAFPIIDWAFGSGGHLAEEVMDAVESTISFISNSFSYLRLLAMAVAHLALMLVIFVVAWLAYGFFATSPLGWVIFWLVVALGNIAVTAFEALLVFIQAMRLHLYEWMMKFFSGSGHIFSPLSYEGRSVRVVRRFSRGSRLLGE